MASKRQESKNLVREMEQKCTLTNEANSIALSHDNNHNKQVKSGNNNDEDYEDNYPSDELALNSGRISGGSRESAFSESGDEDTSSQSGGSTSGQSQIDSASTISSLGDNNSSSGRSSANREAQGDMKILNPHCNRMPELKEALELVETLRVRFLDSLQDEDSRELYDESDLEELKAPLHELGNHEQRLAFRLISRYLHFQQIFEQKSEAKNLVEACEKELNEALEKLCEFLKFRHHYQIQTARCDHFAREFYTLSGIFQFGHDKQHIPILYLRARVHRRWSHNLDETFRRYVAWQMDQITKSYAGTKVAKTIGYSGLEKDGSFAICFDCSHVSYACLDMEFLRFLVKIMVNYYPTYCRYALCVDLPWLFRSVWKLVQTWLPEDARNSVQLITSKQMIEYIDEDQIPNSMKANNSEKLIEGKHILPKNMDAIKGIEEFADELNLTSQEVKQFKAHVEKIRKEYVQLDAI